MDEFFRRVGEYNHVSWRLLVDYWYVWVGLIIVVSIVDGFTNGFFKSILHKTEKK